GGVAPPPDYWRVDASRLRAALG
ncbi:MAG: hypothetical protein ACYCXA_03075, partial [Actinomycetes bacterium]